jgi:hypothetical protein
MEGRSWGRRHQPEGVEANLTVGDDSVSCLGLGQIGGERSGI